MADEVKDQSKDTAKAAKAAAAQIGHDEAVKGPAQMTLTEVLVHALQIALADRSQINKAHSAIRVWYNAQPTDKDSRKAAAQSLVRELDTLKLVAEDFYSKGTEMSYQDRW